LTGPQQEQWYRDVVCNRNAQARFWAVRYSTEDDRLLAQVGLTDIEWENGLAQLSLIVSPNAQGQGVGKSAVDLVLREAFHRMRLLTIYGEVYHCNAGAREFWAQLVGYAVVLPRRKWWEGVLWDATYFTFTAEGWKG
jgi:RimJ/RimL family protein N-acetyltransferase